MADDVCYPWSLINSTYAMTSGVPVFFQIRASADRFYDATRFFTDKTTSMTSFHVSIFKPTAANTLGEIMHLGNVKAQLGTTHNLQTIALSEPLDVVSGEILFVGLLSVGGTPPNIYQVYKSTYDAWGIAGQDLSTGEIPEYHQITALSTATGKTSFAATETISGTASVNLATRIWGALGNLVTAPARPPAFYVDSFNRNNATDLLSPWGGHPAIPRFGVYNQTASPQTNATFGAYNYWIPANRSDDHYIQVRLGADMDSALGNDVDLYLGVRGPRGVSGAATKLHLNPSDGTFRVVNVTRTYDNLGLTERATADDPVVFAAGDTVKIVASATIYTGFHNDDPVTSWVDSGEIHPVDSDHRWVDIACAQLDTAKLQVVDNFEAGDAVGGVQLVALTGIASTAVVGSPTVTSNIVIIPGGGGGQGEPTELTVPFTVPASLAGWTGVGLEVPFTVPGVLTPALPEGASGTLILTGNVPAMITGVGGGGSTGEMVLTGNVPDVRVVAPAAPEINTPRTGAAVPANAIGVFVMLRGGGGGGGGGMEYDNSAFYRYGGGGGGGGAVVRRSFIPRSALGATYTVTVAAGGAGGAAGTNGAAGGQSRFVSGATDWKANGGGGGQAGYSQQAIDIPGGTVSCTGYTPSGGTENGGVGRGHGTGGSTTWASAGGGSGGYLAEGDVPETGYQGGSCSNGGVGGGVAQPGGAATDHDVGGGGGGGGGSGSTSTPGGKGGNYGAGGGGSGGTSADGANGGDGAGGYTRLEWVIP